MLRDKLKQKIDDGFTSDKLDPLFDFIESGKAKTFMIYGMMNIMAWFVLPEDYIWEDGSVFHIRQILSFGSLFFLVTAAWYGVKRR